MSLKTIVVDNREYQYDYLDTPIPSTVIKITRVFETGLLSFRELGELSEQEITLAIRSYNRGLAAGKEIGKAEIQSEIRNLLGIQNR